MLMKIKKSIISFSFVKLAKQNASYIFLGLIFFIGLCVGAFCVRLTGYSTQITLLDAFTSVIYIRAEYGFLKVFSASLITELFYYIIIFIFGLSVAGIAVSCAVVAFKGFCIGFFIGFVSSVFGLSGVCALLLAVIPGMLLSLLLLLIFCEHALQFSYYVIISNKVSSQYERPTVKGFYKKGIALFSISSIGIIYQTLVCPSVIKLMLG
ncbi:MAG: hypothetical protein E7480_02540 [Ruminococcaceae bacterium]|nr:hypothetical protein [Oscillospiraceae bacterium]